MDVADLPSADPTSIGLDVAALGRLDAAIQRDIDAKLNFGASIIVARGGRIAHRKTFGTVAPDRPAADDDLYLLMSMSKAYVAALILKAVDEGRFGLDTRVADLVPGFGLAGKQRATIRHLLTHTAGLPFALLPPGLPVDKVGDLAAKTQVINNLSAEYIPGTRCIYTSAVGFDLLGQVLVITDSSGRPFRQILAEDLFEPLGMRDSSFGVDPGNPRRVPASATAENSTPMTPILVTACNTYFTGDAEFPAGNAFSTIDDVYRFTQLYRGRGTAGNQRLLSPALFDYADRNHTGELTNDGWVFETESRGMDSFPAHFSLLGGYVRGDGHVFTPAGLTASPSTFAAVGGGSTSFIVDFERDLTFIFLSAGFFTGLPHLERVSRLNDLALATVND
ncbi:serine hydrolase domain-containing protein [Mycolicibacterium mengxianglii]|uniref:serine hydrolase domain-containing protein n=1 Tax=Mycolicibacterium mengxianglii TaxID=2736649 RepID=UPI0018D14284|nr:serine hydrolase domain-containing protein [Mycolicibacterium mengxianglii]